MANHHGLLHSSLSSEEILELRTKIIEKVNINGWRRLKKRASML